MKTVEFNPLADKELTDAVVYYEEQEAGLGLEFMEAVEQAVNVTDALSSNRFKSWSFYSSLSTAKIPILATVSHFIR